MLRSMLVQSSALCAEAPRVQAAAIVYSDLTKATVGCICIVQMLLQM